MLGACNHSPSIPPFLQETPNAFTFFATQHLSLAFSSLLLLLSRPTLSHIFGFAYPAYASYKAAKGDDPDLHRQWLMFWCVDICQTTAPHTCSFPYLGGHGNFAQVIPGRCPLVSSAWAQYRVQSLQARPLRLFPAHPECSPASALRSSSHLGTYRSPSSPCLSLPPPLSPHRPWLCLSHTRRTTHIHAPTHAHARTRTRTHTPSLSTAPSPPQTGS